MQSLRTILAKLIYLPMVVCLIVGAVFSAITVFFTTTAIMLDNLSTKTQGDQDDV